MVLVVIIYLACNWTHGNASWRRCRALLRVEK